MLAGSGYSIYGPFTTLYSRIKKIIIVSFDLLIFNNISNFIQSLIYVLNIVNFEFARDQ